MFTVHLMHLFVILVTFWPTVAVAQDDNNAEFAFNIFSDVAPIIALFGEQFARQYMSESLTWLDHVIFAMVPVGIVTAITSAIRVQGTDVARAFIGRARENRALVEFELMSSTSHEVGEAFNGKGIVRVMGRPKITEFLIFPKAYDAIEESYREADVALERTEESAGDATGNISLPAADGNGSDENSKDKKVEEETLNKSRHTCGIHSLESVTRYTLGLISSSGLPPRREFSKSPVSDNAMGKVLDEYLQQRGSPNLQLNLSPDSFNPNRYKKRTELVVTAVLAVFIQTGLVILAVMTTVYGPLADRGRFVAQGYGLPCYVAGSLLLALSVGLCADAVERNTTEYT
ncbi:hypothetical protein B0I35DRAFT_492769 [Stachybotrys elegans]|uniref:Uncharacterized protein n=1 Tax=Stachybotrys elegans TaxID=80388 RepID=A0A8K0SG04_9HYPO|nr:hypothetical protein B0I35DRAFT_492769 [Stachybotrys elegans]